MRVLIDKDENDMIFSTRPTTLTAPCLGFDLAAEVKTLRETPVWRSRGHAARTLVKHPDLRLVLMVLRSGARIPEHRTDHRVLIQTLSGRVRLHVSEGTVDLPAGQVLALEDGLAHDVVAEEDSAVLLSLGGAVVPQGGCQDSLDVLVAEHERFSKLLALIEDEVARIHDGEDPDYELLREVFFYMKSYPDRLHHPKEDLLFARVAERVPAARADIEELRGDHRRIAESGALFLFNLEAALNGSVLPRRAVEEPAREYVALYRKHMVLEERLLPLARAHLSREDCARVSAVVGTDVDPIFGGPAAKALPAATDRASARSCCAGR